MNRNIMGRSKSQRKSQSRKDRKASVSSQRGGIRPDDMSSEAQGSQSDRDTQRRNAKRVKRNRHSRNVTPAPAKSKNSSLALRSKGSRASAPPQKGPLLWVTIALRTLIFGVGIAAIAGTTLSIIVPTNPTLGRKTSTPLSLGLLGASSQDLHLTEELTPLSQKIEALAAQQEGLTLGCFIVDLDTGNYVDINGAQVFPTASMIKFPLLVAFLQDVDSGRINLNEQLTMRKDLVASEAGAMQFEKPNSKFSALYTATEMISVSDNTATNMVLDRLGGPTAMNRRLESWGLIDTSIQNLLPDLEGTNTSSPKDLVMLMSRVSKGDLLSLKSRDRLLAIMQTTQTDTLLPQGLGQGASIAHKTGDIGGLVGDVGLIDMPTGKRYIAAVMVKRPYNDARAQELIRQVSKTSYEFFQQNQQSPKPKDAE